MKKKQNEEGKSKVLTDESKLAKIQNKPWNFSTAFFNRKSLHACNKISLGEDIIFELNVKCTFWLRVRHEEGEV